MNLYLDSCAIIYLVEGNPSFRQTIAEEIGKTIASGGRLVTSRLSRMECRVKPLKENNRAALNAYELFFDGRELALSELHSEVIERATELRAKYNFKAPDAIHLATAIENKVDAFLTGDAGLKKCTELQVRVVSESN